ncbi:MAG: NAD(P)/FAD-dependent oxidoreductase, partial [Pseudomonas sp.]|nr:NAD(P)/FAD-dependent oxidoreductase [Pseudomonas sp.]
MIKTIIVVGGGIGGTMTANNLVSKLYAEISRGEVRVLLISN